MFELPALPAVPKELGTHVKVLIQRASETDIEELMFRMNGPEHKMDYAGFYYNVRQLFSWQMRFEVYQALVLGFFEKFKNHLELRMALPDDLSGYHGKYILNLTVLADASSEENVLYYVNETGDLEPVFIKTRPALARRIEQQFGNFTTEASLHLNSGEFRTWITENGGHVQKYTDPALYTEDLEDLKAQVFASTQAYFMAAFAEASERQGIFDLETTQAYAIQFTDAWLRYMNHWIQGKNLAGIQDLLHHQSEKWTNISIDAYGKANEYREKYGQGSADFDTITSAIAAETPTIPQVKITPLSPLDAGGTTALHLAISTQNIPLINMLMRLISIQKEDHPSYEDILALPNEAGDTIKTLFDRMGEEGVFLNADLQVYRNSTPAALFDDRSAVSFSVPSHSRRPSLVSEQSQLLLGIPDVTFDNFRAEMNTRKTQAMSGPYAGKTVEFIFSLIDYHDAEAFAYFIEPMRNYQMQQEINAIGVELITAGQNQDDYPLDLLHLWHIHLEYKLHKIIHDHLKREAPSITSNASLKSILEAALAELKEIAVDLFFGYDQARKNFFKDQEAIIAPILMTFFQAFEIRELGLSARIFDNSKPLEANIKALSDLPTLLKEKGEDYNVARRACPSHEGVNFLAISIWMQRWQAARMKAGHPLPFVVDMKEYALNKELACLINSRPRTNLLSYRDQYGNTLLHRAIWKKDTAIIQLLLGLLGDKLKWALKTQNHFGITVRDVAISQQNAEILLEILALEEKVTPTHTLPEEDAKLATEIEQILSLYPIVIQALTTLDINLRQYQSTVMAKKAASMDKLQHGNPFSRLFNWLSFKISGKDQIVLYEQRRAALQNIEPLLKEMMHFLHSEVPTPEGAQIFAHLATLYPLVQHILAAPETGEGRFSRALSPLKAPPLKPLGPFFNHLATLSEQVMPSQARTDTASPLPFNFDETDEDWAP